MTAILLYLVVCYLCGSLPFGFAAGLLAGHDVRREGSGNIGFTNVLRVCGKRWGFPVLLLDAFKGFAPVFWLAPLIMAPQMPDFHAQQALGGLMAIIGHSFPVWLRFRGGKGVATGAGVAAALIPFSLVAALAVWVPTVALTRYVSLGSLLAAIASLATQVWLTWGDCWGAENLPGLLLAVAIAVLVWARHRSNIVRLLNGTENKFSFHRQKPAESTEQAAPAAPNAARE